jgi:hypothetical protein
MSPAATLIGTTFNPTEINPKNRHNGQCAFRAGHGEGMSETDTSAHYTRQRHAKYVVTVSVLERR